MLSGQSGTKGGVFNGNTNVTSNFMDKDISNNFD